MPPPFLLVSLLFFLSLNLSSQVKTDSLYRVFSNGNLPDTIRFKAMDDLSNQWLFRNPDTALALTEKGLILARKKNEPKWQAVFLNTSGLSWYVKSDFTRSLATLLGSLEKWQQTSNRKGLARCLGNIGLVFQSQNEADKALSYQQKALAAFREAGDSKGIANTLGNIGNLYRMKKDTLRAIGFHREALTEFSKITFQRGVATSHLNLADLFYSRGEIDSALLHAGQASGYFTEAGNKKGLSAIMSIKGRIALKEKKYDLAIKLCSDAFDKASEIHSLEDKKNSCLCLSEAYEKTGKLRPSLEFFKLYNEARDSLKDEEKAKEVARTELRFVYDKKMTKDSLLHAQENKVNDLRISEQKKQKNYLFILLGSAILFSFFIVNRLQVTRKQKRIIHHQKEMMYEKNREITDSIRYAERIQKAIMPSEEHFQRHFHESFILFRPKDIVSGDFYWLHQSENYFFYAIADCTGHGVPGGFMSMLGSSLLDEVVGDMKIHEPADALDLIRIKIIHSLKQTGKAGENKDGMDLVLIRIDKNRQNLTYAAAYNPLWIISDGKLTEYPPDKQPIGFFEENPKQFNQLTIPLKKGDSIYAFTDGFADQFGGPKGKKFKYRQLQDLVQDLNQSCLSMADQKNALISAFENWKGNLEQVDDITLAGIKI